MATLTLGQALQDAMGHHQAGRLQEAEVLYRQILQVLPDEPNALHGLGALAHGVGRNDLAVGWVGRAVQLAPQVANFHNTYGEILRVTGRLAEAEQAYQRALALGPGSAIVLSNLGITYARTNRLPEAISAFQQAIAHDPELANAHDGLGLTYLLAGELQLGWQEQKWRWKKAHLAPLQRAFSQPEWDGRPLAGRTLLAHAEQGFGDTIQFARYVRQLVAGGAEVVFETQPEVYPLFAGRAEYGQVICHGEALPSFDVHAALMDLPLLLGTTLATIPQEMPCLSADPRRTRDFRERLSSGGAPLVGLVWAGRPAHPEDAARSIAPAVLAALAEVPGVRWVSLQKGPAASPGLPAALGAVDLAPELEDFAATAAALAALDLLISVDTSVVHLAGALARPVWTLLPYSPDWRWLLERADSPWYPTMRLYRQTERGDWASVLRRVVKDLPAFLGR